MKYLVTCATGQLGAKVVDAMLAKVPAKDLAVSVRNPDKAAHLKGKGVDVRQANFDDAASLDKAFAGVDRLLIISTDGDNATRIRQHLAAIAAAKRAGVKFIAYTSLADADNNKVGLAEVHRVTAKAIRETGIPFSFVRNNWYLENETGFVMAALAGAPITVSAGQGKVAWATRDDYAAAAATVLAGPGHENTVYELGGEPKTYDEFATALGEVLEHKVAVNHVDDAGYEQSLRAAGLPEFLFPLFVDFQRGIRSGSLSKPGVDQQILAGRPASSLKEGLAKIVAGIRASK